jgi:phosphotransferase system HPr (HPr) family protein
MSETTASRTVTVINPEGLHLRPAGLFAQLASQFDSKIEVIKDGDRFDGKSTLALLTLVAEKGTQFTIEAVGHDADDAIGALVNLVERGFPRGEPQEQDKAFDQKEAGESTQPK